MSSAGEFKLPCASKKGQPNRAEDALGRERQLSRWVHRAGTPGADQGRFKGLPGWNLTKTWGQEQPRHSEGAARGLAEALGGGAYMGRGAGPVRAVGANGVEVEGRRTKVRRWDWFPEQAWGVAWPRGGIR